MPYNSVLIAELQMEAASTRKMLERVPIDKNDWKPHPKSMKLGRLASHVAELPGWITMTMTTDELDFSKFDYTPVMPATNEELLATLDGNVNKALAILDDSSDADFDKMWTMKNGDNVYFTLPKKVVLRTWAYNHLYHHRGQLSVYLRLLNIPVPGMYGPSADEMPAPVEAEASAN
jgi:uncharacterized damage-inducible protein DinB